MAAAFVALLCHSMMYAAFLEDPLTWTLLGVGTALAAAAAPRPRLPAAAAPAREPTAAERSAARRAAPRHGVDGRLTAVERPCRMLAFKWRVRSAFV